MIVTTRPLFRNPVEVRRAGGQQVVVGQDREVRPIGNLLDAARLYKSFPDGAEFTVSDAPPRCAGGHRVDPLEHPGHVAAQLHPGQAGQEIGHKVHGRPTHAHPGPQERTGKRLAHRQKEPGEGDRNAQSIPFGPLDRTLGPVHAASSINAPCFGSESSAANLASRSCTDASWWNLRRTLDLSMRPSHSSMVAQRPGRTRRRVRRLSRD